MKLISLEKIRNLEKIEVLNNYYKEMIMYYSTNGFKHSANKQIAKIIETLYFHDIDIKSNGSVEAKISFKLENTTYIKMIMIDNVTEHDRYNFLIQKPIFTTIKLNNNIGMVENDLEELYLQNGKEDIEEWLEEIAIFNFIKKIYSA